MGVADATEPEFRLNFELTAACDHRCAHCYNVWGASDAVYRRGQLDTEVTKEILERAIRGSGATFVVITGGEPLLRPDALELIEYACAQVPLVLLVTNGSHLRPSVIERLAAARVGGVQLTVLSARAERHDALKGAACFDDVLAATRSLRAHDVHVQWCFVATRDNEGELAGVMELGGELGVRDLVYNRMSPSGGAAAWAAQLVPTVEQVEADLEVAERMGRGAQIRVSTAMPIPPCLIRAERYPWVQFGCCSTGSTTPNLVVDPFGNVRACNLASDIMGNVLAQEWQEIMRSAYRRLFTASLPLICRDCAFATTCGGGCKESGRAVFGRLDHPEPFLFFALHPRARADASAAPAARP